MHLNRIVCATDFSADAGNALLRAVRLAAEHRAALEVLHVVPRESLEALREWVREPAGFTDRLVQAVRDELAGCANAASEKAGIPIEATVVIGDVAESIVERCASAGLVVLGARGTNPLKDALIGTTAERVAGKSTTPALIVRTTPEEAYRSVLVAVDLLPGSEDAFSAALQLGGSAKLAAVHAYDVPFDGKLQFAGVSQSLIDEERSRAHQKAVARIEALSLAVSGDANRFGAFVERGHPAASVVEHSRSGGVDLVVLLKRARSTIETLVLGSVTRHVVADVETDILLLAQSRG